MRLKKIVGIGIGIYCLALISSDAYAFTFDPRYLVPLEFNRLSLDDTADLEFESCNEFLEDMAVLEIAADYSAYEEGTFYAVSLQDTIFGNAYYQGLFNLEDVLPYIDDFSDLDDVDNWYCGKIDSDGRPDTDGIGMMFEGDPLEMLEFGFVDDADESNFIKATYVGMMKAGYFEGIGIKYEYKDDGSLGAMYIGEFEKNQENGVIYKLEELDNYDGLLSILKYKNGKLTKDGTIGKIYGTYDAYSNTYSWEDIGSNEISEDEEKDKDIYAEDNEKDGRSIFDIFGQ